MGTQGVCGKKRAASAATETAFQRCCSEALEACAHGFGGPYASRCKPTRPYVSSSAKPLTSTVSLAGRYSPVRGRFLFGAAECQRQNGIEPNDSDCVRQTTVVVSERSQRVTFSDTHTRVREGDLEP